MWRVLIHRYGLCRLKLHRLRLMCSSLLFVDDGVISGDVCADGRRQAILKEAGVMRVPAFYHRLHYFVGCEP